jgi:hypothetical protein
MGPGSEAGTTMRYAFSFSRQHVSEVCKIVRPQKKRAHATLKRGRREDRVRAAPAVSCAIVHHKKCAHEHTGSAETLRPSLRNGFTTYIVLSLVNRSFLPPSPPRGVSLPGT